MIGSGQQPSEEGEASPDHDAGFSVLEALVAIAVLGIALLPILNLQGQFARSVTALERVEKRLAIDDAIRAQIQITNLSLIPKGELRVADADITWQARPATQSRRIRTGGGTRSRYQTTLYAVEITINHASGREETLEMAGLGWTPMTSYLQNL